MEEEKEVKYIEEDRFSSANIEGAGKIGAIKHFSKRACAQSAEGWRRGKNRRGRGERGRAHRRA